MNTFLKNRWTLKIMDQYQFCNTHNDLIVCFLLSNSLVPEFYIPMFQNTLFHPHRWVGMKNSSYLPAYEDGTDGMFRNVGI